MMKRIKAFTLVELLVVVAIIALLVSILLPTLGKAKEQARQVVCTVNLRHLSLGATVYSYTFNDYMVPVYLGPDVSTPLGPSPHHLWWPEALHLYGGLPMKSLGQDTSGIFWCPSATRAIREAEGVPYPNWGYYSVTSYAINRRLVGYGYDSNDPPSHSYRRSSGIVGPPAERFIFADCNMSWVTEGGFNVPWPGGYPWWAFLRHQGKACMAFADGHAEKGFELPLPLFAWTSPPPYPW